MNVHYYFIWPISLDSDF